MAERASVTTKTQFGAETTAGTSVAASKWLPSIEASTSLDGSLTPVKSGGLKFDTGAVLGQEWTTTKVSGVPTYDELSYFLSSLILKATPTTSDTTAKTWTFFPSASAEDTVQTYTIETGSSVRAHKSLYNVMTDLSLKGDRAKVEMSGSFMGKIFTDGITITAGPTTVGSQVVMMPGEFSVYSDSTAAGLGTTKLSRVMDWEVDVSSVRSPLWVVDSAETSWSVPVETPVDATVKLTLEADSVGMAFVTAMRANTKKFIRIEGISPTLAGAVTVYHKLTWDAACVVSETPKELKDKDGVYAIEVKMRVVYDSTWTKALNVALINKLAAL